MLDDLPLPPTFDDLAAWAGPGHVIRASPVDLADWRLPQAQKTALVETGVPVVEGVVDAVLFRSDTAFYRLAEERHDEGGLVFAYGAEPVTGRVLRVCETDGQVWLVNSSVNHWLCSLHLVGTWLVTSIVIGRWDEDERHEQAALAELSELRDRIEALDPPSCAGGDHESQYWPAVLDRWLY